MSVSRDILTDAANIIHEGGWQRYDSGVLSRTSPHCVLGAIYVAAEEVADVSWTLHCLSSHVRHAAVKAAYDEARETYGEDLIRWNDTMAVDADEVVHLLKKAAERLDE